jgi:Protein of unknown function (DUF2815)
MKVKLSNVRLSFPDMFTAVEFTKGDGKFRYNATFLIEPGSANDKAIEEAIATEAKAVFGEKWEKQVASIRSNANKFAYLDGDLKDYDGYEGKKYLACHSKVRPTVIDRDKSPLTEQDGRPYAGCYVNATVEIYCQKGENSGVRASFTGVQFAKDGDAFSAGRPADPDEFEDLSEGADAEEMA